MQSNFTAILLTQCSRKSTQSDSVVLKSKLTLTVYPPMSTSILQYCGAVVKWLRRGISDQEITGSNLSQFISHRDSGQVVHTPACVNKGKGSTIFVGRVFGNGAEPVLGSQPAGNRIQS